MMDFCPAAIVQHCVKKTAKSKQCYICTRTNIRRFKHILNVFFKKKKNGPLVLITVLSRVLFSQIIVKNDYNEVHTHVNACNSNAFLLGARSPDRSCLILLKFNVGKHASSSVRGLKNVLHLILWIISLIELILTSK